MKLMVGSGAAVHFGVWTGKKWVTICGAGANRTGNTVRSAAYPAGDGAVLTCKKCLKQANELGLGTR